jgi:hypothetical protein
MTLKSIALAGAALLSLAIPAVASAQPSWGGYDHDGWRRDNFRAYADWGRGPRWDQGPRWGYAPRCFVEPRAVYNGWGHYVVEPVRICR